MKYTTADKADARIIKSSPALLPFPGDLAALPDAPGVPLSAARLLRCPFDGCEHSTFLALGGRKVVSVSKWSALVYLPVRGRLVVNDANGVTLLSWNASEVLRFAEKVLALGRAV